MLFFCLDPIFSEQTSRMYNNRNLEDYTFYDEVLEDDRYKEVDPRTMKPGKRYYLIEEILRYDPEYYNEHGLMYFGEHGLTPIFLEGFFDNTHTPVEGKNAEYFEFKRQFPKEKDEDLDNFADIDTDTHVFIHVNEPILNEVWNTQTKRIIGWPQTSDPRHGGPLHEIKNFLGVNPKRNTRKNRKNSRKNRRKNRKSRKAKARKS